MVLSVGLILAAGLVGGHIARRLHLPEIVGVMLAGMLVGPHVLGALDDGFLRFSGEIRTLAFVIILLKAGLMLDVQVLKKVGRPAILMCFIPATMEMLAYMLFAPALFGISVVEAGIIGSIMGAVSPAVVVPRMTKLMEDGWGTEKGIPQMVVAGASADDVYTVVLFSALLSLASGGGFHLLTLARIPLSILSGVAVGCGVGFALSAFLDRLDLNATQECLLLLTLAFLLVALEDRIGETVPFSGYLAVIAMGMVLFAKQPRLARDSAGKLSKLWTGAELFLFVLVGAAANPATVMHAGLPLVGMILIGLAFRMLGTCLCTLRTSLNRRERIFVMLAEIPKATVQAAIGGIPLAMGLSCGGLALSAAILSIFITAPLGALAIDLSYSLCLQNETMKGAVPHMTLRNNIRTHLNPVLSMHGYCAVFAGDAGTYECEICVHKGSVQYTHDAYSAITGGWDDRPDSGEARRQILREGEIVRFFFTYGAHYGQPDSIVVANASYLKPAEFTIRYERNENR